MSYDQSLADALEPSQRTAATRVPLPRRHSGGRRRSS